MLNLLTAYLISAVVLAILIALLWGAVRLVQRLMGTTRKAKYKPYGITTLTLALVGGALLYYGNRWGRWHHEVVELQYEDGRLPRSFDGYRIVQISDFHLEGFEDNPSYVDTIVDAVNRLDADLIVFTGDLVSYNHTAAARFKPQLLRLKAKDGVVAILGNHDYGIYDKTLDSLQCEQDRERLIDFQRNELGWKLLLNEHMVLHHGTDSLAIIGCENQAYGLRAKIQRGRLTEAMQGTEGMFQLLLTHNPAHWDEEVVGRTHIPLTLCGHTHAMQFKVLGWTPCRLFFKRSDGEYDEGSQHMYVNIGLGGLLQFRVGATPEITHYTLISSQNSTEIGRFVHFR